MEALMTISIDDKRYPEALRRTADPPVLLYIRGNVASLSAPLMVAVVGTRKPTQYGISATRLLAGGLARAGGCIVSGLALGTDAVAHAAALDAIKGGGLTVAVLAGGVDAASVSPRTNWALANRILAAGGALVSEHPPGTPTYPSEFLRRNRIIAGLSRGTIVVEAAHRSGALVTARQALDENRDVFAVPGQITSTMSEGTNALIGRGAYPALSARQMLEHYGAEQLSLDDAIGAAGTHADPMQGSARKLLALLKREPMHMDAIATALKMDERDVLALVTEMEIDGRITSRSGKFYDVSGSPPSRG